MVETKNNKINLFTNPPKDKFANKKIGESFSNLEDQVYKIIKDKIIWHKIKMGERIIDKKLAEELGVSRSIVRQVLNILAKEELLTMVPRNGCYVKEITKKEVKEIYNIRKVLEVYATELAVPQIHNDDFEKIERLFKTARKDLEEEKNYSFIEADMQLHRLLINNCGNDLLKKIVNQYNDRYIFYRVIYVTDIKKAKKSYREHYEIFQAIKRRNVRLAKKLMAEHIENSKNIIITNFDSYTYG